MKGFRSLIMPILVFGMIFGMCRGVNAANPILSWLGVGNYKSDGLDPEIGETNTDFIYRVEYKDEDNDPPGSGYPKLHIYKNGIEIEAGYTMTEIDTGDTDYRDGKVYYYIIPLTNPGDDYTYKFAAEDINGISATGEPTKKKSGPKVTTPPTLSWTGEEGYESDGINPDPGDISTNFIYRVEYKDVDNDPPKAGYPKLHIYDMDERELDGSPYEMYEVDPKDTNYKDGKRYTYSMKLPDVTEGKSYLYRFEAKDKWGIDATGDPIDKNSGPRVNSPPIVVKIDRDRDNKNKIYAMYKKYIFTLNAIDPDGWEDIEKLYLQIENNGKDVIEICYKVREPKGESTIKNEDIRLGRDYIAGDITCDNSKSDGKKLIVDLKIKFDWDCPSMTDAEVNLRAVDKAGGDSGYEEFINDLDIITDVEIGQDDWYAKDRILKSGSDTEIYFQIEYKDSKVVVPDENIEYISARLNDIPKGKVSKKGKGEIPVRVEGGDGKYNYHPFIRLYNSNKEYNFTDITTQILVDNSPPSPIKEVVDDGVYTSSSDQLHAKWSESFDKESGIKEYEYAICKLGKSPGSSDWKSCGLATEIIASESLEHEATYYFYVRAINKAGIPGDVTSSDGITIDTTPPDNVPKVTDEGGYTGDNTRLYAEWEPAKDNTSGIIEYKYCIGTKCGKADVVNWTSIGTKREVTHTGLNLQDGETYYFSVKAKNGAGLWSVPVSSDGITVDVTLPGKPVVKVSGRYAKDKIHASWESTNSKPGVTRYRYAIGTTPSGSDVLDWTNAGYDSEVTVTLEDQLKNGKTYYFLVKAISEKGRESPIGSCEIIGDTVAPKVEVDIDAPYITKSMDNKLLYTNCNDKLPVKFIARDDGSGIKECHYAVGTEKGKTDVTGGWIKTTSTDFTIRGLSLKEGKVYYIGIKVTDNVGNYNTSSLIEGTWSNGIKVDTIKPTVRITTLPKESRIYGNGIYIEAEAEEKEQDPEKQGIRAFKFQYKWDCVKWRDIPKDSIVDFTCGINGEHLVIRGWWDVTGLLDGGRYQLRAVATDQALNEGESVVNVKIDKTRPNIGEFLVKDDVVEPQYIELENGLKIKIPPHTKVKELPEGEMRSIRILDIEGMEKMKEGFENTIKNAEFKEEEKPILIKGSVYRFVGVAIEKDKGKGYGVEDNGDLFINKPINGKVKIDISYSDKVEVNIPYPDSDNDHVVDGTRIPVRRLKVYKLVNHKWEEITHKELDLKNKVVKIWVSGFSVLALAGSEAKPSSNLNNVVIYPNPFKPSEAVDGVVKLIHLTETSKVRIYTLSGELVKVIEPTELKATGYNPDDPEDFGVKWNGENGYGNPVASGLYFILITDQNDNKKILKLSIIRK
ncbi:MAG: hypothetical protein QME40_05760 [bacterium]|nr:hypothetical protein [bacterium]